MTLNSFAMAVARGVWTAAAVGAIWLVVTAMPGPSPGWITWWVVAVIVTTWALLMVLLSDAEEFARSVVWFCAGSISGSVFLMQAAPDGYPDWTVVPMSAFAAAAWMLLVRSRLSMLWSLVLLALAVAFLCPVLLVLPIVTTIGVAKLVVMVVGRRAAVAGSRLEVRQVAAPPRGLVEHCDYD